MRQQSTRWYFFPCFILWPLEGRRVSPDTREGRQESFWWHQAQSEWTFFNWTLGLVGAGLFKLSGCCRAEVDSRTSCKSGPLAPTCDRSLCCGLLKDYRNVFYSLRSHFTDPREILKRPTTLIRSGAKSHS